jgi:hypothetical protein
MTLKIKAGKIDSFIEAVCELPGLTRKRHAVLESPVQANACQLRLDSSDCTAQLRHLLQPRRHQGEAAALAVDRMAANELAQDDADFRP